jgi:hypothetical protein
MAWSGVFLGGKTPPEGKHMHGVFSGVFGKSAGLGALPLWIGSVARLLDSHDGHRRAMTVAFSNTPDIPGKKFIQMITRGYGVYGSIGKVINPKACLDREADATGIWERWSSLEIGYRHDATPQKTA